MRHEEKNVCKECHDTGLNCADGRRCAELRKHEYREYDGIRLTADGFDCALPMTIDSHSVCAYECLYCFANNLPGHQTQWEKPVGRTSIKTLESIFSGRGESVTARTYRKALKYDRRNAAGFPCPVQIGGLCDPCDSIEQNDGWLLDFINLAIKYNQPVRMSTKGAIFLIPEYLKAIEKAPHLFWVAFSIITNDDGLAERIERNAPNTSTRLKAMKALGDIGVKTSLRLRPMIPGVTDKNKGYKELIARAADAKAGATSYESMFYPTGMPKDKALQWNRFLLHVGIDLKKIYAGFGKMQACTRPAYTWTEAIMHSVRDEAHKHGMTVGVSDPVWKQLSDVGCCCGIKPDDPVFGNWERENATNALITARDSANKLISLSAIVPPWANEVKLGNMVNMGAGPLVVHDKRHMTWEDHLYYTWNNPSVQRSAMNYFQGAIRPHEKDADGNWVYKYVGLERQNIPSIWNI